MAAVGGPSWSPVRPGSTRSGPIRSADEQYQAKYHDYAVSKGMGDEHLAAFSTRLKISVDKVWSTPSAG